MSQGVGRGRGWLNLKNQSASNAPGPEIDQKPAAVEDSACPRPGPDESDRFADAQGDYSSLVNKIKHLDVNDDGIMFNQKIRFIIESWYQDCRNAPEVERSFNAIYEASLCDPDMAGKLVLLIASRTFLSQEIHAQNIRMMFLRKLQQSFENCARVQSRSPSLFRNSVQLMGEFVNKARMANGQQFTFMSAPLLSYLDMLLDSTDRADLKLFTTQLYLNGNALRQECPDRVTELLGKIRRLLCSDLKYSTESKQWLLLAIEMANNRFALLPADIHNFYRERLGDEAMAFFQGSRAALTVQPPPPVADDALENFRSHVNVLQQVSETRGGDAPDHGNDDGGGGGIEGGDPSGDGGRAKSGRPILGAGARLQRNREHRATRRAVANDRGAEEEATAEAEPNRGREKKPDRKEWGEDKKKGRPKGWEHDDRFVNDYS